jgi:hypothetical protein
MPSPSTAELLIRIGADPSQAEANIARFRTLLARDLSGMSVDLNRWSAQGKAGFGQMQQAAQSLASHFNVDTGLVNALVTRNRLVLQSWKTALVANFAEVLDASTALESSLGRSFMLFDSALGMNIANAIIWQKSIGEAFRKAALQAVGAIAQEAIVRAIYSTALGFYLLAIQDYRGAALAFKSAAMYGAVGGAAALAGRALAGADVEQAERGGSVTRPGEVAPAYIASGKSTTEAATEQKTIQVIFQGPVYGGQAGIDELVRHISQAVTERDVNLVAYTVVNQVAKSG